MVVQPNVAQLHRDFVNWLATVWENQLMIVNAKYPTSVIYSFYGNSEATLKLDPLRLDRFVAQVNKLSEVSGIRWSPMYERWNGFFVFTASTFEVTSIAKRIYIHCNTPEAGLNVCEVLLGLMGQVFFGIQQFKICGPGAELRADTIVVYLKKGANDPNAFVTRVLNELGADRLHVYYCEGLPLGVEKFRTGVGYADEPPSIGAVPGQEADEIHSFGSFYSDCIYNVLCYTRQEKENEDCFLKHFVDALVLIGINPALPHAIRNAQTLSMMGKSLAERRLWHPGRST